MKVTLLTQMDDGRIYENPVSEKSDRGLGADFAVLGHRPAFAEAMASIGLDPMYRGKVYGYILNRNTRFTHRFYGWMNNRMEYVTDRVADRIRSIEGALAFYKRKEQEIANATKVA